MYRVVFLLWFLFACTLPAHGYQQPDTRLMPLLHANIQPSWQASASGNWLLELHGAPMPTLAEVQRPRRGLAGLNIDLAAISSESGRGYQHIVLKRLGDTDTVLSVIADSGQRLFKPQFSPDENWLSLVVAEADGLFLEWINLGDGKRQRLPERLNAVFGIQYQWFADSSALLVALATQAVPDNAGSSATPRISESSPQSGAQRTLQLLLQNAADETLFAKLSQSRLVRVTTQLQRSEFFTAATMAFSLSPDNRYLLWQQLTQPYSQRVRYQQFAQQFNVLTLTEQHQVEQAVPGVIVTHLPLHERRGHRPGARLIAWRPDKEATLFWAKADASTKQDTLWQWSAPFSDAARPCYVSDWRIQRILWSAKELALLYETSAEQQRAKLFPQGLAGPAVIWQQRHSKDLQADPGEPLLTYTAAQLPLLRTENGELLLRQRQLASAADHLLAVNASTMAQRSLWQSSTEQLEQLLQVLPDKRLLITRQSPQQPAELWLSAKNSVSLLAAPSHPAPAYQQMSSQIIHYQRADGVALSGRLLLPAGYRPELGPLPVLMWAYPREFDTIELAEQQQLAPLQFVSMRASTAQPYVALGYAVFEHVSMPIIAAAEQQPNDSFLTQLTANAEAAVRVLTELGIAEADNIAIGGHSYGAFMVANLLAHTRLFQAGIARSGAYNRTLTPFGFQSEKRSLWQQPQLYLDMSPFIHADKIAAPLLLIHGEADNNSGTFPLQSVRLFDALQGLSKPARLVLLPYEGHHYQAKESIGHVLWEQSQWLAKYLRPTPAMQQLTNAVDSNIVRDEHGL